MNGEINREMKKESRTDSNHEQRKELTTHVGQPAGADSASGQNQDASDESSRQVGRNDTNSSQQIVSVEVHHDSSSAPDKPISNEILQNIDRYKIHPDQRKETDLPEEEIHLDESNITLRRKRYPKITVLSEEDIVPDSTDGPQNSGYTLRRIRYDSVDSIDVSGSSGYLDHSSQLTRSSERGQISSVDLTDDSVLSPAVFSKSKDWWFIY